MKPKAKAKAAQFILAVISAPTFASVVDFEGGSGGIIITGNQWQLTSQNGSCNGVASLVAHSGCNALLIAFDPRTPPINGLATATFDVPSGFSTLTLYYSARSSNASIQIYDGPAGSGNLIAAQGVDFVTQTCSMSAVRFCEWYKNTVTFAGVAKSFKISAQDQRLFIDDIDIGQGDPVVLSSSTPPRSCNADLSKGNPIKPLTGIKTQVIDLGISLGGQPLTLNYDSGRAVRPTATVGRLPSFGGGWSGSWLRSVVSQGANLGDSQPPFTTFRPDGREELFAVGRGSSSTAWQAYSGDSDYLQLVSSTQINYNAVSEGQIEKNVSATGYWHPDTLAKISGTTLKVVTSDNAHPLNFGIQRRSVFR